MDNGVGVCRIGYALAMTTAAASVLRGYTVTFQASSYPYPDGHANIVTESFLESLADEMIIIDTDIVFTPKHLEMLLSHDVPLVSGIYPKKKLGLEFPIIPLPGTDTQSAFALDGENPLVEVECVARGFLRIHRDVFGSLDKHPDIMCYRCSETGRNTTEYWKNIIGGHSDDFEFCRRYRSLGGKVLVDKRILTKHAGNIDYPVKGTYASPAGDNNDKSRRENLSREHIGVT